MNNIRYGRKKSGIKKQLHKKVGEWLASIDDEVVRDLASRNTIVTGGAIASMLLGEKVNDYDIYFRDKETTLAVARYYMRKFADANKIEIGEDFDVQELDDRVKVFIASSGVALTSAKDGDYRPVFLSANAITLSDKMQIVVRFYGDPKTIHDNYDFAHAMCSWDHGSKELSMPAEALECLLSRTLVYKGSLYPVASIFRTKKFIERGWRISAGQQLKIMWQISELNMGSKDVLEEQLTGVDQAYMQELIDALKDVEPEKITSTYVSKIIDRIFG